MAIKPASPRITISEIDKTAVVPGVGASGGAFVGNFRWGPVEQRTLVADEAGLIEAFAEPDNNNTKDWHSAAYFLKYSQTLQIVRMNNGGVNAHSAVTSLSDSATVNNEADWENSVSSAVGEAGTKTGTWIAKYPGSLGNSITVS